MRGRVSYSSTRTGFAFAGLIRGLYRGRLRAGADSGPEGVGVVSGMLIL